MGKTELINRTEIKVRFNEIDSMKVVWHGHYLKYMEDGREAFGKQYGVSYMDFYDLGIMVPLIRSEVDYKKPLKYGESALIETRFVENKAAKIIFDFTIYQLPSHEVVATGRSIQVFLDMNGELLLCCPPYYSEWKKKWDLI
ncbi:MAG: acyl-CoA thioesterase [Bacteroidales bacterium]|nr:acyl-CoA thioesterase [Bacteroidales bacterium]